MSINRVNITGNLTRDPELRLTAGARRFSPLASRERPPPQRADWRVGGLPQLRGLHDVRTRAEAVSRFLAKGNKVAIEGKLRYSSWEKDGQRRSKLEVIVDEIEFMSQRQGTAAPAAAPVSTPAPAPASAAVPPAVDLYDEDIPF